MAGRAMTLAEARDYAPQWGSYMTAGDPGAVMYCDPGDPDAKAPMAAYIKATLLPECRERLAAGDSELDGDPERLESLLAYLEESGDMAP